jgi:hypothetical protein
MDQHPTPAVPAERPIVAGVLSPDHEAAEDAALADPRALTILTTEHWSLLTGRSLVYNEAFARAGMFLSFLAATLVALSLMSNAMGFREGFLGICLLVLTLDLFIGLATMGRVSTATAEDIRHLQGMNRLRHAYHEILPGLEDYFMTGFHDDVRGIFQAYGTDVQFRSRRSIVHGFTTVVGMLGVINAALGGVLVGVAVALVDGSPEVAVAAGVASFLVALVIAVEFTSRSVAGTVGALEVRFPSPAPAKR